MLSKSPPAFLFCIDVPPRTTQTIPCTGYTAQCVCGLLAGIGPGTTSLVVDRARAQRRGGAPYAGVVEENDLASRRERIGDRRIPIVQRSDEMLKKQQGMAGPAAEAAVSISFVLTLQELRWGGDVAGGCHQQEIAEQANRGPASCANGDPNAARLVNPASLSTRPQ